MTDYATHRFSVGQQVVRYGDTLRSDEIVGLIAGTDEPEYRLRSGSSETIVGEHELAYTTVATNRREQSSQTEARSQGDI